MWGRYLHIPHAPFTAPAYRTGDSFTFFTSHHKLHGSQRRTAHLTYHMSDAGCSKVRLPTPPTFVTTEHVTLNPRTQQYVPIFLVNMCKESKFLVFEPNSEILNTKNIEAPKGIFTPYQTHVVIRNNSNKRVRLPKCTKIGQAG